LSPLLFVIVMEVITKQLRVGLPWELLYADDLSLLAETEEELRENIVNLKAGMEVKSLQMNAGKMKVTFCCTTTDRVEEQGKWPCDVYKKGIGNNSITCTCCQKWVHK